MKEYRCRKLGGKLVPKSCHVLNRRKEHCESLMVIVLDEEAVKDKIEKISSNLYL